MGPSGKHVSSQVLWGYWWSATKPDGRLLTW